MTKWMYLEAKVTDGQMYYADGFNFGKDFSLTQGLKSLGDNGWELVSTDVLQNDPSLVQTLIFKKPVEA